MLRKFTTVVSCLATECIIAYGELLTHAIAVIRMQNSLWAEHVSPSLSKTFEFTAMAITFRHSIQAFHAAGVIAAIDAGKCFCNSSNAI